MSHPKYEIEHVHYPYHWFESEIAMLTGLTLDELLPITGKVTRWSGQTYIKVFRKLGFNTNVRFIKFDKATPYPCMMRTKIPHDKSHWAGFVYYDNKIYHPTEGVLTWAEWNYMYRNYRITSMLQVWI